MGIADLTFHVMVFQSSLLLVSETSLEAVQRDWGYMGTVPLSSKFSEGCLSPAAYKGLVHCQDIYNCHVIKVELWLGVPPDRIEYEWHNLSLKSILFILSLKLMLVWVIYSIVMGFLLNHFRCNMLVCVYVIIYISLDHHLHVFWHKLYLDSTSCIHVLTTGNEEGTGWYTNCLYRVVFEQAFCGFHRRMSVTLAVTHWRH